MASVIPDVGGGDIVGGDDGSDGGGCAPSLEVDNWLGSSSYATHEGWQQPEAPLVQSSPVPGCSMGCSEGYGESDYIYYVIEENIGSGIVKYLVHSDGSAAKAVQMETDCAYEDDRPLESTALVKYVKNHGPTSRCHNEEEHKQRPDWFPEPDEFCFARDLGISDEEEDDEVELPYLM
ncbi:hypothetical protein D1007_15942 [Hordeum vulgare]|nr:hypothetical protein D1007_15942 [Hordeum vulgare]